MSEQSSHHPPRHKRIRLDAALYAQPNAICSVTAAVQGRRPVFADPTIAAAAVNALRQRVSETGVKIYGYCVMPDHVHLVLSPSPNCDVISFVGQFKNLAQRAAWQQGAAGAFWQKGFWDHSLRADEDLERVVSYVLNNPVRGGLANGWRGYAYAGSLELDLGE